MVCHKELEKVQDIIFHPSLSMRSPYLIHQYDILYSQLKLCKTQILPDSLHALQEDR